MPSLNPPAPLIAIVYGERQGADRAMGRIVEHLVSRGVTCAGFLERCTDRPGRSRCDMALQDIDTGQLIDISEDRGEHARGCRLVVGELMRMLTIARAALSLRPDLLVVNKFGKTESEGGGFRPLIAEAVEAGVPVLLSVPWRNIDSWRLFAGDLAREHALDGLPADPAQAAAALGLAPTARPQSPAHVTTGRG